MKKVVAILFITLGVMFVAPAFAEAEASSKPLTKEQAEIMLDKIKADKKLITSQNMVLTDAESKAFWPVYDEYQDGLRKINTRIAGLVLTYADAYSNKTLTDAKATSLMSDALAIDTDELALKKALFPKLLKVLPAVKAARYMQIENKLRGLVKLKLGAGIPLAE